MSILGRVKERFVVWVWHNTPHCTEMSKLASQSCDQPLSVRTRLKMRLHFLICVWCERYYKHLKFLHQAGTFANTQNEKLPGRGLSPEARQRMAQKLRANGRGQG